MGKCYRQKKVDSLSQCLNVKNFLIGISLTLDAWNELKSNIDEVDEIINNM